MAKIIREHAILIAAVVMLVLHAAAPRAGDGSKFGKIPDDQWSIGAPQQYPEANAVIIFDHGRMEVTIDKIDIHYHMRMKILTPAGIDEIGDIEITYDDDEEKLKGFKAHTITPDGATHKVEGDAIFEKKAGHYKTRTFSFPALEVGSIVEYEYDIIKERGYRFLKPWYFQNRFYTYESKFIVELGQGFSYKVAFQNVPFSQQKPVEEKRLDVNNVKSQRSIMIYTWAIDNIAPIREEPYMSSIRDYQMAIRFQLENYQDEYTNKSYFESWGEVGKQFGEFLDDYCNREKEVRKLAEQLTAGIDDPREKARVLFDYVTTEYKTSEDTQGRWFIHDKMSMLMEEKYESAEGKNLFLAKLLQAAGIAASPVLISTRDNARFDPRFPSVRWFNYIVVFAQFGDKWEFLDTSSRYAIFGVLPPKCLTEGGLLIDGENSDLVKIAVKSIDSFRFDYNRLYVDEQGVAVCSTISRFGGYYAAAFTARYDENTPADFAKSYYLDKLDGDCELDTCCLVTDTSAQFAVALEFTSNDLAERLDNNLLVKPLQFAFNKNQFKSEKRQFPVDFSYPFIYRSTTELHLTPQKLAEIVPPEDLSLTSEGLAFKRHGYQTDSTVVVETELQVKNPLFEPQLYGKLREFFDSVALSTEDAITAVLKTEAAGEQSGKL